MNKTHPPLVRIIKVGTLCHEASELASTFNLQLKSDLGIGGGSTVTLIETGRRILVDTGYEYEWLESKDNVKRNSRILKRALRDCGIAPDDIDVVFITHWHRDHFGNLEAFKKARHIASKPLIKRFGLPGFTGADDGEEIADGVKVRLTPGHTADHASILVDTTFNGVKARIAIAGDAIVSHSYFQTGRIWRYNADFHNADEAKESVSRLIHASDVVIPGHGVPFMAYKPNAVPQDSVLCRSTDDP